jgi:hypothetical protein
MRAHWGTATLITLLVLGASCIPLFGEPTATGAIRTFTPGAPAPATLEHTATSTDPPQPFALDLTPLPTATALPELELPTQSAFQQGPQVWDGLPTYPAESKPDFYFRLVYDPNAWALTINQFGYPALANRGITGCSLAPAAGRGLPMNGSVAHEVRQIGNVTFQVSTASVGGAARFVNYAGGDGVIYTAFEASFSDSPESCLAAAEGVLGTLRSVRSLEATPATAP